MTEKNTIWIDLTDLVVWKGHFTGIQRVVYEYASRFNDHGARFFIYDVIDQRHVEVNLDLIRRQPEQVELSVISRRRKVKLLLGRPYYNLSASKRAALRPTVDFANSIIRTTLSRFIDNSPISVFRTHKSADFSRDDKVVLIGAGWNHASSLELLCELRDETGIKIIQHINDILPIYQPHLFADELSEIFTPYTDLALRNADIVTVISLATKRDVEIYCSEHKIKKPRIEVVRLGEDVQVSKEKQPLVSVPQTFVLSVGTFEIRKNYLLLYQAAKLAQLEGKDFPNIVIVGRKGWLTEDLSHVVKYDPFTKNKIVWVNGLSDAELEWLYRRCMFTVFPSLAEGWGLPIVESLQHGKTSLASGVSSMLEIGDGLIDYFSPYDVRSCMDKLLEYSVEQVYQSANEKVKAKYTVFTWDESFQFFYQAVNR